MNKATKKSLALGLILCLILCATLLAACDPKEDNSQPPQPKPETYTVNVTCDDAAALENVKVQIKDENGEQVGEKALTEGKTVFELVPANYTATLSGIAEEYAFEDGVLTATDKECTIEVTLVNVYTVYINYKTSKDVFGNTVTLGGPAEGVTVSLYVGQLKDDNLSKLDKAPVLAATAQTDAGGKATFKLPGEIYTVVVSGLEAGQGIDYRVGTDPKNWVTAYTVSTSAPTLHLPMKEPSLLGTDTKNTIPLKLGENDIPLSRDVFMELDYPGVFFTFTPEETGEYTFTTTSNAKIIDGEGFSIYNEPTILIDGAGSFVLSLEKGTPHMLVCSANNEASLRYTLTIEKGNTGNPSGPSDPTTDVNATPFETFECPHSVSVPQGDPANDVLGKVIGDVAPVWYSFTATENATYILSDPTQTLWLKIFENNIASPTSGWELNGDEGDDHIEFTVTAGTTYYFWICTWSEDPGTVTFTIAKK